MWVQGTTLGSLQEHLVFLTPEHFSDPYSRDFDILLVEK